MNQIRKRLTYANVMSSIAVFLMLGGGAAIAANQLGKNTVGTKQLKKNAVTGAKVKRGTIQMSDLKAGIIPAPVDAYTKSESDGRFSTKGETAAHSYSKGESDGRYLRGTVTVVKTIAASVASGSFVTGEVKCPSGYQAVGGGIDPNGVFFGKVSATGPLINGARPVLTPDGQYGPANGWFAAVTTEGASSGVSAVKMAVVCSPLG